MPATLWGANEITQILFSRSAEPPAAFYLALGVAGSPNYYMSGNEITEPPSGSGYARMLLPNDSTTFAVDGFRTAYNISKLSFTEATADWGTVTYWALCNDAIAGDVYFYGYFANARQIVTGDIVVINPATLKVTMSVGPAIPELT